MLHTTTDTLPLPILSLVSACSTWSPGYKGHIPGSCISPTLMGHTIMSMVSLSRGFTLHSRIWVWNGPNLTCSFTKMGPSISLSVDSADGVWASSAPPTALCQHRQFHAYSPSAKLRSWPTGHTTCQFHSLLSC